MNSEIFFFVIEVNGAKILLLASLEVSYYAIYYHIPKTYVSPLSFTYNRH